MLSVELTGDEQKTLIEIIESSLSELEIEIHRTDSIEFKQVLRRRWEILKQLLLKFSESRVTA